MARFNVQLAPDQRRPEVFRVIDDGVCIMTTTDPYKALKATAHLIEKHDVTACWVDIEPILK